MEYWLCTTGDDKEPGINGAIMKRMNPGQPFANHISTPNIDKIMKDIEAAGGQIVVAKMSIPGGAIMLTSKILMVLSWV